MRRTAPRRAAVALALLPLVAAGARADDSPPVAPAPKAEPKAEPKPGPGPAGIEDEARRKAILAIVDDLRDDAARIRGLDWKFPVPADVITRTEMRKDFERMVKEEVKPDVLERELKLARRMGLLAPDEDPIAMTLTFMERGVAGYYDPKRRHFYVVDGLSGEAQRPTILHELIHALEDQHFDLRKQVEAFEEDPDGMFAVKCVQEGSAETARKLYEREHPDVARMAQLEQAKSPDAAAMLKAVTSVPASLVVGTLLNYQTGPAFVGRAVGDAYPTRMTELYGRMPTTQEQVLRPSKFLGEAKDLPRKITWPEGLAAAVGEGWKGLKPSPAGELDVALWLDRWLGGTNGRLTMQLLGSGRYWSADAAKAAEGWDGAYLQCLEVGGTPTAVAGILAWDTPADAREAGEALLAALRAQHGAKFEGGAWADGADGRRVADFRGPFGAGRVAVVADVVRYLDGVPADALDRAFAALEAAPVVRREGDTWTAASEPDPLAGAAWVSPQKAEGFAPKAGTFEVKADGAAGVAKAGDLTLRLETLPGALQAAFGKAIGMLMGRHPGATLNPAALEELSVADKSAARVRMDDPAGTAGAQHRWVYVIPRGDHLLLVTASAPPAAWDAAQATLAAALERLVFKD